MSFISGDEQWVVYCFRQAPPVADLAAGYAPCDVVVVVGFVLCPESGALWYFVTQSRCDGGVSRCAVAPSRVSTQLQVLPPTHLHARAVRRGVRGRLRLSTLRINHLDGDHARRL